jgi:hypothetical protein
LLKKFLPVDAQSTVRIAMVSLDGNYWDWRRPGDARWEYSSLEFRFSRSVGANVNEIYWERDRKTNDDQISLLFREGIP